MKKLRSSSWAYMFGAVIVTVVAVQLIFWWSAPRELEFRELSAPAGYRALVLNGGTSRPNPVLDVLAAAPDAEDAAVSGAEDDDLCTALLKDEASPSFGDADAALGVVAFLDVRCPYCRTLSEILVRLHDVNEVRVIYKDWPILGPGSRLGARAALAAAKQDKYLAFHSALMQSGFVPTPGYIRDLSSRLGLDHARLQVDMDSAETSAALDRNAALARRVGLAGTPVLIVGRTVVEGAISEETLGQLVAEEMISQNVCQ